MIVQSYLFFTGKTLEAIEFYKQAIGAEPGMVHYFKDMPDASTLPPGMGEKVMHTEFKVGQTTLFASDGDSPDGKTGFQGFALTISTPDAETNEKYFNALKEGGEIRLPLGATFFSPSFGMVVDKFGILWMLIMEENK